MSSELIGPGEILSEETVLDERFFPVVRREIQEPSGNAREQLVWDRSGKEFSVALAITADEEFILIREPKYGQTDDDGQLRAFLSIPTGGIRKDETAKQATIRELLEEAGYEAQDWVHLRSSVYDFVDKVDGAEHHYFLGFNAKQVSEPQQSTEIILVSREEAEKLIQGEVEEIELEIAMSIVGLALGVRYLKNNSS